MQGETRKVIQAFVISHIVYGLLTVITLNIRPFTPWLAYLFSYAMTFILLYRLLNFGLTLSIALPFISGIITLKLFLLYIPSYETSLKLHFPYSLSSIYYDGKFVKAPSPEFTHISFPFTILLVVIAEIICQGEVTVVLHLILSSITLYVYLLQVIKKFHYKEFIDEITRITAFLLLSYLILDFYWQELRFSYRSLGYLFMVLTSLLLLKLIHKQENRYISSDILMLALLTNSTALTDLLRFVTLIVTLCIILLISRKRSKNIIDVFAVPILITLVLPGAAWVAYNSAAYIPYLVSYIKVILNDIRTFITNAIYCKDIVTESLEVFRERYRGTLHDFVFATVFNFLFLLSQLLMLLLSLFLHCRKVHSIPYLTSIRVLSIPAAIILIGYLIKIATAYTGTLKTAIGDISDVIIRFYIPTLSTFLIVLLLCQDRGNTYHQGKVIFHINRIRRALIIMSLFIMISLHGIAIQNWCPKSYLDPLNSDSDMRIISKVLPVTFKFLSKNVDIPIYVIASKGSEVLTNFMKVHLYANHLVSSQFTLIDKTLPRISIYFHKISKCFSLIYSNGYYAINIR